MKILLIDDDPDVLVLASHALETLGGHTVVTSRGGLGAVETARRERPDAILLDVWMPELDGPDLARRLRAEDELRGVPLVFLTGHQDGAERRRLLALGARGVLAKPFDPETLSTALEDLLATSPR